MASPDPEVLDADQIAEYGDDPAFVQELMDQFELEFEENVQGLEDAIDTSDFADCFLKAHTIKGVCGNIGAKQLYHTSSVISTICRQLKIDGGGDLNELRSVLLPALKAQKQRWDHVVAIYLQQFN